MKEIIAKIKVANNAYAKGIPIMTDTEYDVLWKQLYQHDPKHPLLYHTSQDPNLGTPYYRHLMPIFGTQKAFNINDMKPFLQRFGSKPLQIEPKYDGVAAMLYYEPSGYRLVLHGDGHVGKDISHHLQNITYPVNQASKQSIELIIPMEKWKEEFGANPRNTVAGWLNRDEPNYPANTIKAVSHTFPFLYLTINPPYNLEDLSEIFLQYYSKWSFQYPMDGLMIKLQDEVARTVVSHNGTVNLWSIAWKPPISTKETTVKQIHWNVSRQGRVIPTIEYEPIELCGTINTMVTGNNAQWIMDNLIYPNVKITVGKAGEIIPKIVKVHTDPIKDFDLIAQLSSRDLIPFNCFECGESLTEEGVHLICDAPNCIAQQVRKLAYFYSDKGMEIKSFGEKMLHELFSNQTLKAQLIKRPWLLLDPKEYLNSIEAVWGAKRTQNYLDHLDNMEGSKNPAHFIAALGYDALAYKSAVKCFQQLHGKPIRGNIPHKAIDSFVIALAKFMEAKKELSHFTFAPLPTTPDKIYCITGTLSIDRNEMIQYLTEQNWQFSNQVSKFTDYLILGEIGHETTKSRKAIELSVTVIKEHDIQTLIKEKFNDT